MVAGVDVVIVVADVTAVNVVVILLSSKLLTVTRGHCRVGLGIKHQNINLNSITLPLILGQRCLGSDDRSDTRAIFPPRNSRS